MRYISKLTVLTACSAVLFCFDVAKLPANAAEYRLADVQEQMKYLNSQNPEETKSAVSRLSEMGPIAEPAVTRLIQILNTDENYATRGSCAQALGHIGSKAVSAVPSIIAFLQDKTYGYERAYGATALGDIGLEPATAVPALIDAFKNEEDPVIRGLSAQALGSFGADASVSIPDLVEALKNGDKNLREYAAYALCKIPARASDVPLLLPLLSDEIDCVREAATKSVGGAKADGAPAIPQLIVLLSGSNVSIAAAAATSLGEMGPSAKSSVSALKLAKKNPQLVFETTQALNQISGK